MSCHWLGRWVFQNVSRIISRSIKFSVLYWHGNLELSKGKLYISLGKLTFYICFTLLKNFFHAFLVKKHNYSVQIIALFAMSKLDIFSLQPILLFNLYFSLFYLYFSFYLFQETLFGTQIKNFSVPSQLVLLLGLLLLGVLIHSFLKTLNSFS